jgi:hypothetical protein
MSSNGGKGGMGLQEGHFWIGLTVFGTGLFLVKEDYLWGGILCLVGAIWLFYALRHDLAPKLYRLVIASIVIGVAVITTGYDIYEHWNAIPAISNSSDAKAQQLAEDQKKIAAAEQARDAAIVGLQAANKQISAIQSTQVQETQKLKDELAIATQDGNSTYGPNFVDVYDLIRLSDKGDIVIDGTAANQITDELNVSVDYRTQGIKGTSPMSTWRHTIQSIGVIPKTRKGARVGPIPLIQKIEDHYVIGNDREYPLNAGEIAYIRLVIGNNREQHVYLQVIWPESHHEISLFYPALSMNWVAAWEQSK